MCSSDLPGPNQAVYFATKAFVKSFSEALDQELRGRGVTSTVLAPGYVETEFAKAADLEGTKLVSGGGKSAASVAKHGYDAMMRGELVTVNERGLGFIDRKSTRLNSSHPSRSRMPSSA